MDDSLSHLSISLKSTPTITALFDYFSFSPFRFTLFRGTFLRFATSSGSVVRLR